MPTLRHLVTFLALVAGISMIVIAIVLPTIWSTPAPQPSKLELVKVSLQVLLVVVFGTVASVLLAEFNRKRGQLLESEAEKRKDLETENERRKRQMENLSQYRRDLMKRLAVNYSGCKKCKRLFRARAVSSAGTERLVRASEYDKLMQEVNDVQLDLEEIGRELERADIALPEGETVRGCVRKMEQYLSQLVGEYEQRMPAFHGDPSSWRLSEMPILWDLIRPHSESRIGEEFTQPYYNSIAALKAGNLNCSAGTQKVEGAPNLTAPADQKASFPGR